MTADHNARFAGQVALVTGAGAGIGRASALRLGNEGARVAVCDVRAEAAQATVEMLRGEGVEAIAQTCDVRDEVRVAEMVADCAERLGPVSLLHNNAGVLKTGSVLTHSLEDWELHFAVNVRGLMLVRAR